MREWSAPSFPCVLLIRTQVDILQLKCSFDWGGGHCSQALQNISVSSQHKHGTFLLNCCRSYEEVCVFGSLETLHALDFQHHDYHGNQPSFIGRVSQSDWSSFRRTVSPLMCCLSSSTVTLTTWPMLFARHNHQTLR